MRHSLKIVFLADTHLGFDYPTRPRVAMRRRGDDFFANFQYVLDYAVRTRPDMVVHGGDLFFRSRVPQGIVDKAYAQLSAFAQSNIPLFLVPGNHERSRLPTSLWLTDPNIHVFDKPRTCHISLSGCTVAVSGFPCVRDDIRQHFRTVLDATGWQDSAADLKLVCMHQTVEGSQVGPGNYTFRHGPDVLPMSYLPSEFVMVLSGHIHRRQVLTRLHGKGEQPVIYPGSIERTSFAEKDEPKGFFEIELVPDASGSWHPRRMAFLEIPTRPMVELDVGPGLKPSQLSTYLVKQVAELDPNAIVRLQCPSGADHRIREKLTAAFIRSVFPPSMNVELGAFFNGRGIPRRKAVVDHRGPDRLR